jgi:hypothetical protein
MLPPLKLQPQDLREAWRALVEFVQRLRRR